MSKIIYHYIDGSTYTVKGEWVSHPGWEDQTLTTMTDEGRWSSLCIRELPEDILAIEDVSEDEITIYKNPKYKLSVVTDIKTTKQRCKENNKPKKEKKEELELKLSFKTDFDGIAEILNGLKNNSI